jgi:hypothetical protein
MKEKAKILSILVETLTDNGYGKKQEYEEELGAIMIFARKLDLEVQEIHNFNEATDKNPELLQKLKTLIEQGQTL